MMTIFKLLGAGLIVLVLLVSGPAGSASAGDQVNYRLKWLYNASVIGDIYAVEKGYFTKAKLNVRVKQGGPERNAIRELEMGHALFGVASADQVIRAVAKGSPVVVVAQLFQVNPLHWVYRSDRLKVGSLQDLKNKIIGITYGGNDENIMLTLLAKAGLREGDYTPLSVRYDLTPFYRKKADFWPCYLNSQGVILKQKLGKAGESVAFLNPADYGVKFVANSVITSEKYLREHPDQVKSFVTSLMAAWEDALDPSNEKQALRVLAKWDNNTAADIQAKQLAATRPLVKPAPDVKIGYIDVAAWRQTEQIMLTQKQIAKPIHIENVLKPMY